MAMASSLDEECQESHNAEETLASLLPHYDVLMKKVAMVEARLGKLWINRRDGRTAGNQPLLIPGIIAS